MGSQLAPQNGSEWMRWAERQIRVLNRHNHPDSTPRLDFLMRAPSTISGGGVRKVSSVGVSWDQRFILMGGGKSTVARDGFFSIISPPSGTVIPVYGGLSGTSSVTVTGGTIPLAAWQALYYALPIGSTSGSDPGRFAIVDYRTVSVVPTNWVLICVRNGEATAPNHPLYRWSDGRLQDYWRPLTLLNGWAAFGSGWPTPAYRVTDGGEVTTRGLIKSGTLGSTVPATTVPAALAPDGSATSGPIFIQMSSSGMARVDVYNTGNICVVGVYNGGATSFVSLDNMRWFPAGS